MIKSQNLILALALAGLLALTACKDQPEPGNSKENEQSQNEPQQPPDDPSLKTCTNSDDCADDEYCDNGCRKLLDLAQDCTKDAMCKSGHCASGVCCQTSCDGDKKSCRTASSSGYCVCRGHFSGDNCERCENTYFGDNCAKKIYCEHGVANDGPDGDGHCLSCNEGWSGKDCDLPKTCQNGTANVGLTGNGECSSCQSGWVGPNCDIPNNCLYGHIDGDDIKSDGTCACDIGYTGKNCQETLCQLDHATGLNPETGHCQACIGMYYGAYCETGAACNPAYTIAVNQETGECSCDNTHTGPTCNASITCNKSHLAASGSIKDDGTCSACMKPYYGSNCDQDSKCNPGTTASVNQTNGSCTCSTSYSGTYCQRDSATGFSVNIYLNNLKWRNSDVLYTGDYYYYTGHSHSYYLSKNAATACSSGWRLPKPEEVYDLLYKYCTDKPVKNANDWQTGATSGYQCRSNLTNLGFQFEKAGSVYIDSNNKYQLSKYGEYDYFALDSTDAKYPYILIIDNYAGSGNTYISYGNTINYYSVRCVQDFVP